MGEHKNNPTAQKAKNGELPPKPPKMSKRQKEALLMGEIEEVTGIRELRKAMRKCEKCGEEKVPVAIVDGTYWCEECLIEALGGDTNG